MADYPPTNDAIVILKTTAPDYDEKEQPFRFAYTVMWVIDISFLEDQKQVKLWLAANKIDRYVNSFYKAKAMAQAFLYKCKKQDCRPKHGFIVHDKHENKTLFQKKEK